MPKSLLIGLNGISIHPPREGWDPALILRKRRPGRFQSTHPVRGGTGIFALTASDVTGISIHPPREGWDEFFKTYCSDKRISIHPPREGWDL